jgi:hypothetical protein
MTRHLLIFLGTFLLGAVAALALRTARHPAPPGPDAPPAGGAYAPLVSTGPATPAPTSTTPATAATATAPGAPVNSVCAICGMKVDPRLPTLEYRGQRIGFGCKLCPPKFQAEPDKYGPYYLRNAVFPR